MLKECEGRFIWEILAEDWDVFDDSEIGRQMIEAMYGDCYDDRPLFLDNYMEREDEFYGRDEEISNKLKKQWNEFCEEITYKNRFFPQTSPDMNLLGDILSYSEERIAKGECLYRARLSLDGQRLGLEEMGAPPKLQAADGRANPKWISYLYAASDADTAISELRPQVHNSVTVGIFKANSHLAMVDLRNPYMDSPFKWGDRLAYVLDIYAFLRVLGYILSKPVDRNTALNEYLPTQYLCEFIKNKGYDGVLYNSGLADGHNMVVFDERKLNCIATKLYRVASIRVESEIAEQ